MSESSQPADEQSLDRDFHGGARITIECTEQGELGFHCDWDNTENGATCMATILSVLGREGISKLIIANLQDDETEQDRNLDKVIEIYNTIEQLHQDSQSVNDDQVAITPLDAASYLL